jgi:threonine aldolase
VLFQRKQLLQLGSKMRFVAAQFLGLLEADVWLHNARHSNAMALRLADHLDGIAGAKIAQPVESNAVFVALEPDQIATLQQDWHFHVWDEDEHIVRLMTAFDTAPEDVDAFAAAIAATANHG